MISNDERREVARRLREVNPYRNQSYTVPYNRYTPAAEYLAELAGALGYSPKNDVSRLGFQNHLADLIEPEPERTCRVECYPPGYEDNLHYEVCSECGTILTASRPGDRHAARASYCPSCGALVIGEETGNAD
jgi:hypothetical protein